MQWRPIETAPRDGTEVLITCAGPGMLVRIGRYIAQGDRLIDEPDDEAWWRVYERGMGYGMRPTLWMPVPFPPES